MKWEETDKGTVMHMLGYGKNIWTMPFFREAVVYYNLDIPTLQYLIDTHIKLWGSHEEVEAIKEYLNFMQSKEKLGVD